MDNHRVSNEGDFPRSPSGSVYSGAVPALTTAAAVAAELRQRRPDLRTVQLQKLLYYCQGYYLQDHDEPLFADSIMAYDLGPVVASLWHAEKEGRVDEFATPSELPPEALAIIDHVLGEYGTTTGRGLIAKTHRESPWLRADARRQPGGSVRIELEWIRDWFRGLRRPMSDTTRLILDGARARAAAHPRTDDVDGLKARLLAGR
jgi:uncharacterized phage-associated protein